MCHHSIFKALTFISRTVLPSISGQRQDSQSKPEPVFVLIPAIKSSAAPRAPAVQCVQFTTLLTRAPIHIDTTSLISIFHDLMPLADKYGLTVYDAAYLELALRLGISLATLDAALAKAARAAGVTLL